MSSTMTSALNPATVLGAFGKPASARMLFGEIDLAAVRRGEPEARLRRHVVNDLQHGAAFVRAARRVLEDHDGLGISERVA